MFNSTVTHYRYNSTITDTFVFKYIENTKQCYTVRFYTCKQNQPIHKLLKSQDPDIKI